MASCQYGQIAGGTCGSSVVNPANVKGVVLAKRTKAIQGHLRPYNVQDATLVLESRLLLARAGICIVHLQNMCKGSFYIIPWLAVFNFNMKKYEKNVLRDIVV